MDILRTEGVYSAWCKLLALLGYRRVVLIARSLDQPRVSANARIPVTVRRLTDAEVADYLAFRPEADEAGIRRRRKAGHECFAAWFEGRIVHACWVVTGRARVAFLARDLDLGPDEIYADESYTRHGFRGYDIPAERSARMADYYRRAGYRRSLAVVFPENRPACRAAEKAGYRPVATIGYLELGPWRWDFYRAHPVEASVTTCRSGSP